jgi:hypothetical protein
LKRDAAKWPTRFERFKMGQEMIGRKVCSSVLLDRESHDADNQGVVGGCVGLLKVMLTARSCCDSCLVFRLRLGCCFNTMN